MTTTSDSLTSDVQLRDVRESDIPVFFEHQADPVANQMAAFPPRDKDTFISHWARIMRDETVILRAIIFDGQVAGHVVSFVMSGEREVGYWIGREYWGKGIATKALAEFLGQIKIRPLYAYVARHNIGSQRVLEKCGFMFLREDKYSSADGQQVEGFVLILRA